MLDGIERCVVAFGVTTSEIKVPLGL